MTIPSRVSREGNHLRKTFALVLEPLRHASNPKFRGILFRRERTQIRQQGGLWDTASGIYPMLGAKPNETSLAWRFPSGAEVKFAGLKDEADKLAHAGAQYALIGFDELCHFSEQQFWFLFSRLRTDSGVRPVVRATCNPDPNSWVKALLAPWVDTAYEGERLSSGELRWIRREGDAIVDVPEGTEGALSLTFIPASLDDNPALVKANPGYRTALENLPLADRLALLDGSWDAVASGNMFRPDWWSYFHEEPEGLVTLRAWDMASTAQTKDSQDPDWMVGTKLGLDPMTRDVYVLDVYRARNSPAQAQQAVVNCAHEDGQDVSVVLEAEPGSSSKLWIDNLAKQLLGYDVRSVRSTGSKETRAKPLSSYVERGHVWLRKGARWLPSFVAELSAFPDKKVHDDQVDSASLGFNQLRPWGGNQHKGFIKRGMGWV